MDFKNTIADAHNDPAYCGVRDYSFSPTYSSFLTYFSTGSNTMRLETNNVADVGVYTIVVTVFLLDYPLVPSITKTVNITIYCKVLNFSFNFTIAWTTTLKVGIDTQPMLIPFTVFQSPACGHTVTIVYKPTKTFLSSQSVS